MMLSYFNEEHEKKSPSCGILPTESDYSAIEPEVHVSSPIWDATSF
jgi:hypothetical protein